MKFTTEETEKKSQLKKNYFVRKKIRIAIKIFYINEKFIDDIQKKRKY